MADIEISKPIEAANERTKEGQAFIDVLRTRLRLKEVMKDPGQVMSEVFEQGTAAEWEHVLDKVGSIPPSIPERKVDGLLRADLQNRRDRLIALQAMIKDEKKGHVPNALAYGVSKTKPTKDQKDVYMRTFGRFLSQYEAYELLATGKSTVRIPTYLKEKIKLKPEENGALKMAERFLPMQYDVAKEQGIASPRELGPIASQVLANAMQKGVTVGELTDMTPEAFLQRTGYDEKLITEGHPQAVKLLKGYVEKHRKTLLNDASKLAAKPGKTPEETVRTMPLAEAMIFMHDPGIGEFMSEAAIYIQNKQVPDFYRIAERISEKGTLLVQQKVELAMLSLAEASGRKITTPDEKQSFKHDVRQVLEFVKNSGDRTTLASMDINIGELDETAQPLVRSVRAEIQKSETIDNLLKAAFLPAENKDQAGLRDAAKRDLEELMKGQLSLKDAFELFYLLHSNSNPLLQSTKVINILKKNKKPSGADVETHILFTLKNAGADGSLPDMHLSDEQEREMANAAQYLEEEGLDKISEAIDQAQSIAKRAFYERPAVYVGLAALLGIGGGYLLVRSHQWNAAINFATAKGDNFDAMVKKYNWDADDIAYVRKLQEEMKQVISDYDAATKRTYPVDIPKLKPISRIMNRKGPFRKQLLVLKDAAINIDDLEKFASALKMRHGETFLHEVVDAMAGKTDDLAAIERALVKAGYPVDRVAAELQRIRIDQQLAGRQTQAEDAGRIQAENRAEAIQDNSGKTRAEIATERNELLRTSRELHKRAQEVERMPRGTDEFKRARAQLERDATAFRDRLNRHTAGMPLDDEIALRGALAKEVTGTELTEIQKKLLYRAHNTPNLAEKKMILQGLRSDGKTPLNLDGASIKAGEAFAPDVADRFIRTGHAGLTPRGDLEFGDGLAFRPRMADGNMEKVIDSMLAEKRLSPATAEAIRRSPSAQKMLDSAIKSGNPKEVEKCLRLANKAGAMSRAVSAVGVAGDAFGVYMAYCNYQELDGKIEQTENPALKELYKDMQTKEIVVGSISAVGVVINGTVFITGATGGLLGVCSLAMLPITVAVLAGSYAADRLYEVAETWEKDEKDWAKELDANGLMRKIVELGPGEPSFWAEVGVLGAEALEGEFDSSFWEKAAEKKEGSNEQVRAKLLRAYFMKTLPLAPEPNETEQVFKRRHDQAVSDAMSYILRKGEVLTGRNIENAITHARLCARARELKKTGGSEMLTWKDAKGKEVQFDVATYLDKGAVNLSMNGKGLAVDKVIDAQRESMNGDLATFLEASRQSLKESTGNRANLQFAHTFVQTEILTRAEPYLYRLTGRLAAKYGESDALSADKDRNGRIQYLLSRNIRYMLAGETQKLLEKGEPVTQEDASALYRKTIAMLQPNPGEENAFEATLLEQANTDMDDYRHVRDGTTLLSPQAMRAGIVWDTTSKEYRAFALKHPSVAPTEVTPPNAEQMIGITKDYVYDKANYLRLPLATAMLPDLNMLKAYGAFLGKNTGMDADGSVQAAIAGLDRPEYKWNESPVYFTTQNNDFAAKRTEAFRGVLDTLKTHFSALDKQAEAAAVTPEALKPKNETAKLRPDGSVILDSDFFYKVVKENPTMDDYKSAHTGLKYMKMTIETQDGKTLDARVGIDWKVQGKKRTASYKLMDASQETIKDFTLKPVKMTDQERPALLITPSKGIAVKKYTFVNEAFGGTLTAE